MAKYSGRVRVFLILIFTVLIKITVADRDPFADPSLEIIKQEDAEEGIRPDLEDRQNKLESKSFVSPPSNKGAKRFLESLLCKDPKSPDNIVRILEGSPNHLYSTIEVSCPNGRHLANGQEAVNVTCLPLPDPCYCKASWETLDKYLLFDDFKCTGPNPVPCRDPTPVNGALEVVSGVPFVILNITVKVTCLHGLQFPDGTTEVTAECLPAPTPYHITGVWVPDIPNECIEPKTESGHAYDKILPRRSHKRFLESLECSDPKTPENTVQTLDGDPFHMNSKIQVSCNDGLHFDNGLDTVNVTCLPLPHPCMCMAAWTRQTDYQLMYNFNCTEPQGTQNIVPKAPPIQEDQFQHQEEIEDTKISQENLPVTENEAKLAKSASDKTEYKNSIRVETNSEKDRSSNEIGQPSNTEIINTKLDSESQIYENSEDIYHQTKISNNEIDNTAFHGEREDIPDKNKFGEKELQISETAKIDKKDDISNSEIEIESNIVKNVRGEINKDERNSDSESRFIESDEEEEKEEEENEDIKEENENDADNAVKQIEQPPLAINVQDNPEEMEEEGEIDEAKVSESSVDEENEPSENTEENEHEIEEISQEENENEQFDEWEKEREGWNHEIYEEKVLPTEKYNEYSKEVQTLNKEEEMKGDIDEEVIEQDHEEENGIESEEETWEGETPNYAEGEDEIRLQSNIVVLDETLPMKGTSLITDEVTDHEFANEDEEFGATNELDEDAEEIEEEIEYNNDIEESPENENQKQTEMLEENDETLYEDDGVERPGPLHELQQTPFHRTIEEEKQMKTIENEDDPCLLPPDSGRGRQVHKRYFFNSSSQECDSFIYGGNGGNENNFETVAECIAACYTQKS